MSNSSWCDLNNKVSLIKVHNMCPNLKCKGQKRITFAPNQFQLERAGFKKTIKKFFKGTQGSGN